MFGSLKKKLSNALQEGITISENLQQQYKLKMSSMSSSASVTPTLSMSFSGISSMNASSNSINTFDVPPNINASAGCGLFEKYEDEWLEIREANQQNAKLADKVALQISNIEQKCSQQKLELTDMNTCLNGVSQLIKNLKESHKSLVELQEKCQSVEKELEILQDLCEECDLQEEILHKQCELNLYKQNKMGKHKHVYK